MLWCVPIACNAIYSFISTFLVFPYTFLDSSLCGSGLVWCISPHSHSVMLALRYLSHIGTILMYFIRLGFYFCSQYPLAFFCEDITLMFSLYLSMKVDYRLKARPVI